MPFLQYLKKPLCVVSCISFLTAVLFVSRQVPHLSFLKLSHLSNSVFYLIFGLVGAALLYFIFFDTRYSKKSTLNQLFLFLFVLLPSTLTIFYGVIFSKEFHFVFQLGSGLALILTGGLFYRKYTKDLNPLPRLTLRAWIKQTGFPTLLFVLFMTATFFSFGLYRLGEYAAVDEPLWLYGRIGQYWNNIGDREWHKTDVSDKPGITVSILSGAALLQYDPHRYDDTRHRGEVYVNKSLNMVAFFRDFRLPLLICITLLLPLLYFLLERLLGRSAALIPFSLVATAPLLVGVTKIINPDALLWMFTTLALISYLVFQKRPLYRYLFVSGLFLGLALLTKYIANIVFIYLLMLLFVEYLYNPQAFRQDFSRYLKNTLIQIGFVTLVALSTFYLILPANWVDPMELITGTLLSQAFVKVAPLFMVLIVLILLDQRLNRSRIITTFLTWLGRFRNPLAFIPLILFFGSVLFVLITTWLGMPIYDFMQLIASPKTISSKSDIFGIFVTNFYPLVFGMTPVAVLGIIASTFFLARKDFYKSSSLRFGFYITLLAIVYYLGATVNGVASIIRYQIIIFPLVALLGGIGLFHFARLLERRFALQKDLAVHAMTALVVFVGAYTLATTHFPLSYASSLLPERYYIDLKDMGPGSYEMAEKLNALPDAKNLLVWTDKDGVCQFFVGRCKRGNNKEVITDQNIDYVVISSAREVRTGHMIRSSYDKNPTTVVPIHLFYEKENPDFEVRINDRPSHYVRAFRYEGVK